MPVHAGYLQLFLAFIAMNLLTCGLFVWDKRCAQSGTWRVSERTLLLLAALGGSVGAKIGQRRFRHKTRKEPFRTFLNGIVVLHIALLPFLVFPTARTAIGTFATSMAASLDRQSQ